MDNTLFPGRYYARWKNLLKKGKRIYVNYAG
jgi:hypothetical protein